MTKKSTPPKSTTAPSKPVTVSKNFPGNTGKIRLNSMPKYQAPPPPPTKKK